MDIDTVRQDAYHMKNLHNLSITISTLYECMNDMNAGQQLFTRAIIKHLETIYEKQNQHYITFSIQSSKQRETSKDT